MDSVSAASTEASDKRYRIAIGPHPGGRHLLFVEAVTADRDGFSLNAAVCRQLYQRHAVKSPCPTFKYPR